MKIDDFIDLDQILKYEVLYMIVFLFLEFWTEM